MEPSIKYLYDRGAVLCPITYIGYFRHLVQVCAEYRIIGGLNDL